MLQVQTGLTVRLQPLLLARRLLLLTLELRALLTAVVLAPLRLILFCVTDLLVRLGRLVLRAQQVLKDHKAILELRGLQVRRVRQAPRVLRERLVLLVLMVRMALMVRLRRLRSALPHLLRTRVRRRSPTAALPVPPCSTLF